jgi:hypothetical protein
MKIKKIDSCYFIDTLFDFKKHKKVLLDLISKMPDKDRKSGVEQISKTDWNVPKDYNREYLNYFYNIIQEHMYKMCDFLHTDKWIITNAWFQQYKNTDRHDWHTHTNCHFTSVFYLELPEKRYSTQIFNSFTKKIIKVNVKEGDILTFPSYLNHRSIVNNSNKRKTIISFNSNFDEAHQKLLMAKH